MRTYDYFCTWVSQRKLSDCRNPKDKDYILSTRDIMTEQTLFGKNGLAYVYPEVREHLYFVIDDGWDVPFGTSFPEQEDLFGGQELNKERFPSFTGKPCERLKQLCDKIKNCGWKGLGIWVSAQKSGKDYKEKFSFKDIAYWKEKIEQSKFAGVSYWKVDWGVNAADADFRQAITALAKKYYPNLIVEHALVTMPFNGLNESDKKGTLRFAEKNENIGLVNDILKVGEVFRSYDVCEPLEAATTLDRVAYLMKNGGECVINCEDEAYIGAALGMSLGIMRSPYTYDRSDDVKTQEAVAAVKWHLIAPVFSGGEINMSEELLMDFFEYKEGVWYYPAWNSKVIQYAPAIISRDCDLPIVEDCADKPYIIASMNPNGVYSIASVPRCSSKKTDENNPVVIANVNGEPNFIGVFGKFKKITFRLNQKPVKVVVKSIYGGKEYVFNGKTEKNISLTYEELAAVRDMTDKSDGAVELILTY